VASARDLLVPDADEPSYARNEEEEPDDGAAREVPEELRNGAPAAHDPALGKDEVHRGIHRFIGEQGEVRQARTLAGRKELDTPTAVPSPDPSHPRAAEGTAAIVEQDRPG
jgi:phage-related minor tail protein